MSCHQYQECISRQKPRSGTEEPLIHSGRLQFRYRRCFVHTVILVILVLKMPDIGTSLAKEELLVKYDLYGVHRSGLVSFSRTDSLPAIQSLSVFKSNHWRCFICHVSFVVKPPVDVLAQYMLGNFFFHSGSSVPLIILPPTGPM